MISDDVRLALAPDRTYQDLAAQIRPGPWGAVTARLFFSALVIATTIVIAATGRVTLLDLLFTAIGWSFVLLIQTVAGAILIRSSRGRFPFPQALELLFAAHVPWSLWMLTIAAWIDISGSSDAEAIVATALIPTIWTAKILSAFCRVVLQVPAADVRRRVVLHQAVIWSVVILYITATSALGPRLLGAIGG